MIFLLKVVFFGIVENVSKEQIVMIKVQKILMKKIRWFHRNLHRIDKLSLFIRFLILIRCIFLHFNLDCIRNIDMNIILLQIVIEKGVPFVLNESILLFFTFKLNFVIRCVFYKLIMKLLYQSLKILFDSVKFGNLFVKFLWGLLNLTKF